MHHTYWEGTEMRKECLEGKRRGKILTMMHLAMLYTNDSMGYVKNNLLICFSSVQTQFRRNLKLEETEEYLGVKDEREKSDGVCLDVCCAPSRWGERSVKSMQFVLLALWGIRNRTFALDTMNHMLCC